MFVGINMLLAQVLLIIYMNYLCGYLLLHFKGGHENCEINPSQTLMNLHVYGMLIERRQTRWGSSHTLNFQLEWCIEISCNNCCSGTYSCVSSEMPVFKHCSSCHRFMQTCTYKYFLSSRSIPMKDTAYVTRTAMSIMRLCWSAFFSNTCDSR